MGLLKEMKAYCRGTNGKVGLKVVVGRDTQSNLEKYAAEIGGQVYFDTDGTAYASLGANGVPAWIVLDSERVVVKKFAGLVTGVSMDRLVDVMIDQKLDLGEFM